MDKVRALTVAFLAMAVFLSGGTAFAEVSIKSEVNRNAITTDETIVYKLSVVSQYKNLPPVELPDFSGFIALSQAQSSSLTLGKAGVTTRLVYTCVLAPQKTGKLKIEPATVKVKDKVYSSDATEVEVRQGKRSLEPLPEESPVLPEESQPDYQGPQITL